MRAQTMMVGGWMVLSAVACGPRSDEVGGYKQLEDNPSGPSTGAGETTGSGDSVAVTSGPQGAGGSGSGTSLHTGTGTTGSGGGGPSSGSGGSAGACCSPTTTAGCSADPAIETCVCMIDSYCCQNEWDPICVWQAKNSCQSCPNAQCYEMGDGEPNETEQAAYVLSAQSINDCNSAGGSFDGSISGPTDVDWYSYQGTDSFFCVVDPTRTVSSLEAPLRVCHFFECKSGTANVSCPSGTTAENSPDGRKGCCGSTGFTVELDCTGTSSEDATVYVRLDQPGAPAGTCNHYSATYHY